MGEGVELVAHEYSVFKYEGASAEEFVSLLLYKDFDRHLGVNEAEKKDAEAPDGGEAAIPQEQEVSPAAAVPGDNSVCRPGLLDPSADSVGISNKAHAKCTNSI